MRVLVTGASGFIGSALTDALRRDGHEAIALVRHPASGPLERRWNPATMDASSFEGADAIVHLAGENIAAGRWTADRKRRIAESRSNGTRNIALSMAAAKQRPKVLVSASAVGYYGDRDDEVLPETAAPGSDFLAQVAKDWEAATEPAVQAGVRVVKARIGVVLSGHGGALPRMALPFKFGVGGRVGSGRQWMSWITLDDLVRLLIFALGNESLRGPVNAVSPQSVTNAEFTRTLARVLHRPALLPAPAFALRLLLGEMADALLLSSQRVEPRVALESGFRFQYPQLETALGHVFGKQ